MIETTVDRAVAPAALGRSVLIGRAAVTLVAAGAGLRMVDEPQRLAAVLGVVVLSTVAGLTVLARRPLLVRRQPILLLLVDWLVMLAILAVSRGGVAYFSYAAGSAALAGVLLGMRGLPVWCAHAALGYGVAAVVLRVSAPPADIAGFVLAFPMVDVLAGIAAAVATAALVRYVNLSVDVVASAQRSAAAAERARLARELHDSVAKTLRGVSFAALALPSSLRRHPALAEQLAATVSEGATVAAREARELLDGLRLDAPDQHFSETLRRVCEYWSTTSGVAIGLRADNVDPPVAVRYELARILQEALRNAVTHAAARHMDVALTRLRANLVLTVRDDGRGMLAPTDLSALHAEGHYGLVGMYERARQLGGTLQVDSPTATGGTLIRVAVPLESPATPPNGRTVGRSGAVRATTARQAGQ